MVNAKSDDDVEMGMRSSRVRNEGRFSAGAIIDWEKVMVPFAGQKQEALARNWQQVLLTATAQHAPSLVQQHAARNTDPNKYQAELILLLMSLPEYQLC
jgi:hypothetical protein